MRQETGGRRQETEGRTVHPSTSSGRTALDSAPRNQPPATSAPELRRRLYQVGNRLHEDGHPEQARQVWQQLALAPELPEAPATSTAPPINLKHLRWKIAGSALLTLICLYVILFTAFPRRDDPFLALINSLNASQPRSVWEEFWDTGRPSLSQHRYLEADEVWPMLQEMFETLLGQNSQDQQQRKSGLEEWLERYRKLRGGPMRPTDYYVITGRGLFNTRRFNEAIAVFQEGLRHTKTPEQRGSLFQEIGTTYYYQGYHLQPNGLAEYDLRMVQKSVDAYEQAIRHTEGPYLYGNLGWGYYLLEDYDHAVEYGQRALAMDPKLNYVRMNLGITFLRQHHYSESFQAYESILRFDPDALEYEGGLRDLLELEREHPGHYPFIPFILGFIYKKQERYALAHKQLGHFLSRPFPDSFWKSQARRLLQEMGAG